MSALAYCYQYQPSAMASQQTAKASSQASPQSPPYLPPQHQYSRRSSSPDGFSHSPHRRSHSLSGPHTYNQDYLFPERQTRWSGARQELGLTRTLSHSRSPPPTGTIRMPIIESGSYDDGWVPTARHFTPLPAPADERQREYHSHRRRSSISSPTLSPGEWAPSASRSTSPCSVGSSRRSSRSSEKRVTFARKPEIF